MSDWPHPPPAWGMAEPARPTTIVPVPQWPPNREPTGPPRQTLQVQPHPPNHPPPAHVAPALAPTEAKMPPPAPPTTLHLLVWSHTPPLADRRHEMYQCPKKLYCPHELMTLPTSAVPALNVLEPRKRRRRNETEPIVTMGSSADQEQARQQMQQDLLRYVVHGSRDEPGRTDPDGATADHSRKQKHDRAEKHGHHANKERKHKEHGRDKKRKTDERKHEKGKPRKNSPSTTTEAPAYSHIQGHAPPATPRPPETPRPASPRQAPQQRPAGPTRAQPRPGATLPVYTEYYNKARGRLTLYLASG